MKRSDLIALQQEPACSHSKLAEKSGCSRPVPGATAGGCAFDGAQIALLPIADVAHIIHGTIACAGYAGMLTLAERLVASLDCPIWPLVRQSAPWHGQPLASDSCGSPV